MRNYYLFVLISIMICGQAQAVTNSDFNLCYQSIDEITPKAQKAYKSGGTNYLEDGVIHLESVFLSDPTVRNFCRYFGFYKFSQDLDDAYYQALKQQNMQGGVVKAFDIEVFNKKIINSLQLIKFSPDKKNSSENAIVVFLQNIIDRSAKATRQLDR